MIIVRTGDLNFLFLKILAARRKSEILPLVQEAITASLTDIFFFLKVLAARRKTEVLALVEEPVSALITDIFFNWLTGFTLLGRCGQATCGSNFDMSYSYIFSYLASLSDFKFLNFNL